MSFDYSAAKAALKNAGHAVSAGEQVVASDIKEIVKFGRRIYGLPENAIKRGIANPELLPAGFPGTSAAPVAEAAPVDPTPVPEAAPVAETPAVVETPAVEETPDPAPEVAEAPAAEAPVVEAPAEEAPKAKKSKKAADESAPAAEAPAAEQAAQ